MSAERYIDVPDGIKPKCFRHCPRICEGLSELALLSGQQTLATGVGRTFMERQEDINEQIDSQAPPEVADQVKDHIRRMVVGNMDSIDAHTEEVRRDMLQDSASCSDPLTMRVTRDGTTYQATICTARGAYPDTPTHAPAHVRAMPSN